MSASAALTALAGNASQRGAPKLDSTALQQALASLQDWQLRDERIEKTFRFASYADTIGFVNAIAWIAQRLDHHPDLEVGYDRCRVMWTTHDAQGVTINDCIAAARTELLLR